ncbi:AraC family transcriptional regulator [Staphylococcus petrasii]|uniref:AraC family transcriptional regulator n=1 Tax=Staphylococcus petrasii TaxID=1276936 RepID=UPI001F59DBC8|nr:AraC family transcriptional regulator [Staphylococcus petrasii]MCI2774389.1 AraC family transcriptional regulator [Staphylococcus petrasii]
MDKDKLEMIKTHALEFFNLQVKCFHLYDLRSLGLWLQTPFTNTRSQYFRNQLKNLTENMNSRDIYIYNNKFNVKYLLFKYRKYKQIIVVGPYLITRPSEKECHYLLQKNNLGVDKIDALKHYLLTIPLCQQTQVDKTTRLAFKFLKGKTNYKSIKPIDFNFHISSTNFSEEAEQYNFTLNQLEKRYELENKFLTEVANGNAAEALKYYRLTFAQITGIRRGHDLFVTTKYFAYLMNALCRKVIERSGVNLLTVDAISGKYATIIDEETSIEGIEKLTLVMIEEYANATLISKSKKYSTKINKVIQYMELHLSYEITLDNLAQIIEWSPSYLSRRFKKEVGQTISQFLTKLRVQKSEDLLKNTEMTMEEIAHYIGFKQQSYFTACFKNIHHISPKQYRKLNK